MTARSMSFDSKLCIMSRRLVRSSSVFCLSHLPNAWAVSSCPVPFQCRFGRQQDFIASCSLPEYLHSSFHVCIRLLHISFVRLCFSTIAGATSLLFLVSKAHCRRRFTALSVQDRNLTDIPHFRTPITWLASSLAAIGALRRHTLPTCVIG